MFDQPRKSEKDHDESVLGAAPEPGSEDLEADSRDWEKELENIVNVAAESVFDASDEEIAEELRSMGEDPDAVADDVRAVLLGAVDRYERSGRPVRAIAEDPVLARARRRPS